MKAKLLLLLATAIFLTQACKNAFLLKIPNSIELHQKLSDYQVFSGNPVNLIPQNEFKPYFLSSELFTDYAEKQRLIKLPAGAKMLALNDGLPNFPDGTILVKTFYYFNDKNDTLKGKKLIETRVLIKENDKWNAGTYKWNDEQTEANLLTSGMDLDWSWINEKGEKKAIKYHIPSSNECSTCHNTNKNLTPIGPKIRNLNIDVKNGISKINQLTHFQNLGMMENTNPNAFTKLPNWKDTTLPLETRARAYLDINCAHCHNEEGYCAGSSFAPSYQNSFKDSKISSRGNRIIKKMKSGAMPLLGTTILHEEGLTLITKYINNLQ